LATRGHADEPSNIILFVIINLFFLWMQHVQQRETRWENKNVSSFVSSSPFFCGLPTCAARKTVAKKKLSFERCAGMESGGGKTIDVILPTCAAKKTVLASGPA
jgi:hypothetical protein